MADVFKRLFGAWENGWHRGGVINHHSGIGASSAAILGKVMLVAHFAEYGDDGREQSPTSPFMLTSDLDFRQSPVIELGQNWLPAG